MFGGRWNSCGTPMLYTAACLSLACLEVLVHLDKARWPDEYLVASTDLYKTPYSCIAGDLNNMRSTQEVGDKWVIESRELALRVPSVVIAQHGSYYDGNILLNPTHHLFGSLNWTVHGSFTFDTRFFHFAPES